jgi:hypothetical protein
MTPYIGSIRRLSSTPQTASLAERLLSDFAKANNYVYNLHSISFGELLAINRRTQRVAINVYEKTANPNMLYISVCTFELTDDTIDEEDWVNIDDDELFNFEVAKDDATVVDQLKERLLAHAVLDANKTSISSALNF